MNYYVERSVNGRVEWLRIATPNAAWTGSFCLVGEIPVQHRPS
jgi:hypothetical protein